MNETANQGKPVTVTYFEVLSPAGMTTGWTYQTADAAQAAIDRMRPARSFGVYTVSPKREVTLYEGQKVTVHAFGRRRAGTIQKINKSRAVVEYCRNAQLELHTRSFPLADIRPRP